MKEKQRSFLTFSIFLGIRSNFTVNDRIYSTFELSSLETTYRDVLIKWTRKPYVFQCVTNVKERTCKLDKKLLYIFQF
jgi:hypothetical protein